MDLELIVGGTPPVITSNFEALKLAIQERLAPYRIAVTEENLAEAKKLATELGKGAKQLNDLKQEKAKAFIRPIDDFKNRVMELVGMIQEGQEFLKKQVKVFEDKRRQVCQEAMLASLKAGYLTIGVRPEYQTCLQKIQDLVGISKILPSGVLTKAAEDSVFDLCRADRGVQDLVDGRLARLEAECFKAGLKTPLRKEHVQSFLLKLDAEYQEGFERLIKIEISRQEEAERIEKEKADRKERERLEEISRKEYQEKLAAEKKAQDELKNALPIIPPVATPPIQPVASYSFSTPIPPVSSPKKTKINIVVRFQIETSRISPEELEISRKYFETNLTRDGIDALLQIPHNISIEKGE